MKIALLGGTGASAPPSRCGSARRATTSSSARATPIGRARRRPSSASEGAANEDAAEAADLVVIATKADGAVETARSLREAIGTTPVLSVAAELSFSKDGVAPTPEATSIAERGSRTSSTRP